MSKYKFIIEELERIELDSQNIKDAINEFGYVDELQLFIESSAEIVAARATLLINKILNAESRGDI